MGACEVPSPVKVPLPRWMPCLSVPLTPGFGSVSPKRRRLTRKCCVAHTHDGTSKTAPVETLIADTSSALFSPPLSAVVIRWPISAMGNVSNANVGDGAAAVSALAPDTASDTTTSVDVACVWSGLCQTRLSAEEDDDLFLEAFSGEVGIVSPLITHSANHEEQCVASQEPLEKAFSEPRRCKLVPATLAIEEDNAFFLEAFAGELGISSPLAKHAATPGDHRVASPAVMSGKTIKSVPSIVALEDDPSESPKQRFKGKHWSEFMVTKGTR